MGAGNYNFPSSSQVAGGMSVNNGGVVRGNVCRHNNCRHVRHMVEG